MLSVKRKRTCRPGGPGSGPDRLAAPVAWWVRLVPGEPVVDPIFFFIMAFEKYYFPLFFPNP